MHLLIHHKKGQVAVLDLFIASLIFGIIVATIMFTWNSYNIKIEEQLGKNTDLVKAYHISDLLTRYPGKPAYWELNTELEGDPLIILGLASEDRVLDTIKVSKFMNFTDDYIKSKLRINSYEFYFRLANIDDSDLNPVMEKGIKLNESAIVLKRYVIYNEKETMLEFWLQK